MDRRTFLRVLGAAAGANAAAGCGTGQEGAGAVVADPDARAAYLRDLLDEFASLGPRPIGSTACHEGAAIIHRELARSCDTVVFDDFTFERWKLAGEPLFRIGDTVIDAFPGHGTAGTPPGGVTGVLVPHDEEGIPFILMKDGNPAVYVTSRNERAVPLPYYSFDRPVKCPPHVNVGSRDLPRLTTAAQERTPVTVRADVSFLPDTTARNVAGRIGGEGPGELLFIAHHDTVYNTVGANDNTASVIVMIMLAHALAANGVTFPVTFLATTGEEYNKLGAINYAAGRRREGTFDNIDYMVNFDSLTWGPNMLVQTEDSGLHGFVTRIDRELALPGDPILAEGDGFALDGRPFWDDSIRAAYINSRGYDHLAVWHRPEDTPSSVPVDCAEIGFRLFGEYVRRLMGDSGHDS